MTRARLAAAPLTLALSTAAPLALALSTAAAAQDNTRLSADVAATLGVSNNPFAQTGDDTGSALVSLDFLPRYTVLSERSTLSVSAAVRLQQYLRRYARNENYAGSVDYSLRPSERVRAHTRLDVTSAVLGGYDSYVPVFGVPGLVEPVVPGTGATPGTGTGTGTGAAPGTGTGIGVIDPGVPLTPVNDIGLFGLRNRRTSIRASGDLGISLSARDNATLAAFGELSRYGQGTRAVGVGDYRGYGTTLGYSRVLSETVSVGLQGSATLFDYDFAGSDTRVYSVEATGSARLSAAWTANGSLGVSFVEGGTLASTRQTSLSGSVNVCRRGERSSMCAQAARSVRPTGLNGSQYVTSAGANWSLQLSERETVSWNATYSKVGGADTLLLPGGVRLDTEFGMFSAGYNRQVGQRLRLIASANVRQVFGQGNDRSADYGGQAGLSYRFGDIR